MLFIQTELCELGNLSDFLSEFGKQFNRLDEPRIWKIMSEVGNGILHIHHQNIIHLDLKPENIFVTMEGRLRIGDFGMATRWPRPASFDGENASRGSLDREGDREYLAPEILQGQYGREADIFSFGMIMLECAGNIVVPSMGPAWHNLRNKNFSDVDLSGLTPSLVDMITRLMEPLPERRPLIDQVCGHPVVQRTRRMMLQNIEVVRRASANLLNEALPDQLEAARETATKALFSASACGTEDSEFFDKMFESDNDDEGSSTEDERMDLS
ncbi:kinase-like protein [Clavulina sp. PMI_390]|nr:kinase-like protein [Clavulina sp. PMI_390]